MFKFRQACYPNGLYNYTPSHCKLRRESPVPGPEDDDLWVFKFVSVFRRDALNEDGEEEAFDRSVSVVIVISCLHRCLMLLKKKSE